MGFATHERVASHQKRERAISETGGLAIATTFAVVVITIAMINAVNGHPSGAVYWSAGVTLVWTGFWLADISVAMTLGEIWRRFNNRLGFSLGEVSDEVGKVCLRVSNFTAVALAVMVAILLGLSGAVYGLAPRAVPHPFPVELAISACALGFCWMTAVTLYCGGLWAVLRFIVALFVFAFGDGPHAHLTLLRVAGTYGAYMLVESIITKVRSVEVVGFGRLPKRGRNKNASMTRARILVAVEAASSPNSGRKAA